MAHGISVHIGLNSVDKKHYADWIIKDLNACENDANSMAALCKSQGITPAKLLTRKATRQAVLKAIAGAAAKLKSGDLFVLTYSGHGAQVPDVSGDEADRQDETWCLYDGQLIDDELYAALSKFKAGCRVLVLSDSCHSGTMTRAVLGREGALRSPDRPPSRLLPPDVARATYEANKAFYDGLQNALRKRTGPVPEPSAPLEGVTQRGARIRSKIAAGAILVSGCQDNQESDDGTFNGAFTSQLLAVWNHGAFKGSHVQFHKRILAGMPQYQSPALSTLGKVSGFLSQRPFTL